MPRNEYETFQRCSLIVDGEACSGTIKVIDSRPQATYLRRRRKCLKCGDRYSTYEITSKHLDMVHESETKIQGLIKAARDVLEALDA